MKKVMVCGADCHPGDDNCNGYCRGTAPNPPDATTGQQLEAAQRKVLRAMSEVTHAQMEYAELVKKLFTGKH